MKTRLTSYGRCLRDEFGTDGVWLDGLMEKP